MKFKRRSNELSQPDSLSYIAWVLSLYCVDITNLKERQKASFQFLRIICILLRFLEIIPTFWCMYLNPVSFQIFSLLFDTVSFFMWYQMCRNSKKYADFISDIRKIRKPSRMARLSSIITLYIIAGIMLIPSVIAIYDHLYHEDEDICDDGIWAFISSESLKLVIDLTQHILMHILTFAFLFITAAFYVHSCMELNHAVCSISDGVTSGKWDAHRRTMLYATALKALKKIEESMSGVAFMLLAFLFTLQFRTVMYMMFGEFLQMLPHDTVILFCYMFVSFSGFISIVFAADRLQSNLCKLRRLMLNCVEDSSESKLSLGEMANEFLTLMEDRSNIHLTAWNTFYVQRSLLLTAAASLISYSVLLDQYRK